MIKSKSVVPDLVQLDTSLPIRIVTQEAEVSSKVQAALNFARLPTPSTLRALIQALPEFRAISTGDLIEYPLSLAVHSRASTSEKVLSKKNIELDRLVVMLRSLDQLLDGSESAYLAFSSGQPHNNLLSRNTFNRLSYLVKSRLDSKEKVELVTLGLIYNTLAKADHKSIAAYVQSLRPTLPESVQRSTALLLKRWGKLSDNHTDNLSKLVKDYPKLLPGLSEFSEHYVKALKDSITRTPNLGQFLRLENIETNFLDYSDLSQTAKDLHIVQFLCQISGARGHDYELGSLTMTESQASNFLALAAALNESDERAIYSSYVKYRAEQYGIAVHSEHYRSITRLACLLDLENPEQANKLVTLLNSDKLSGNDVETILSQLNRTGLDGTEAILLYHSPQLLSACLNPVLTAEFGFDERCCYALSLLAALFRKSTENLKLQTVSGYRQVSVRKIIQLASMTIVDPFEYIDFSAIGEHGEFFLRRNVHETDLQSEHGTLVTLSKKQNNIALSHPVLNNIKNICEETQLAIMQRAVACMAQPTILRKANEAIQTIFHIATQFALFVDQNDSEHVFSQESIETGLTSVSLNKFKQALFKLGLASQDHVSEESWQLLQSAMNLAFDELIEVNGILLQLPALYNISLTSSNQLMTIKYQSHDSRFGSIQFYYAKHFSSDSELTLHSITGDPLISIVATDFRELNDNEQTILQNGFITLLSPGELAIAAADKEIYSADGIQRMPSIAFLNDKLTTLKKEHVKFEQLLGLTIDAMTLRHMHNITSTDSEFNQLLSARSNYLSALNNVIVRGSAADYAKMQASLDILEQLMRKYQISRGFTDILIVNNLEQSISAANELAHISENSAIPAWWPGIYDFGGSVFSKTAESLKKYIDSGAKIITCRDEQGVLVGYCITQPSILAMQYYPEIANLYSVYGRAAMITYIITNQHTTNKLPVYELLINRVRLEHATDDVIIGNIVFDNRRSLLANTSTLGRGVLYVGEVRTLLSNLLHQGYNSMREKLIYEKTGHTFPPDENSTHANSVALVAPLSAFWRDKMSVRWPDRDVFNITRLITNRNLPALFNRDLADLLELWYRVTERGRFLAQVSSSDLSHSKVKLELDRRIPNWQKRVMHYFSSICGDQHLAIEDTLYHGSLAEILALAPVLDKHADVAKIRQLLNYFDK